MTLHELIKNINEVDEELIIFQKDELDINAEIVLLNNEDGANGVVVLDGEKYLYLLEVSIAKEFIEGWMSDLPAKPTDEEITQRVWEFAINDA